MKTSIILGIILILINTACTQMNTSNEKIENFSLQYSATNEFGTKTTFFIHNNVFVLLEESFDKNSNKFSKKISQNQLIELVKVVRENNFFELNEKLGCKAEDCMDGLREELEIILNNEKHRVSGYCILNKNFLNIEKKLYNLNNELQKPGVKKSIKK